MCTHGIARPSPSGEAPGVALHPTQRASREPIRLPLPKPASSMPSSSPLRPPAWLFWATPRGLTPTTSRTGLQEWHRPTSLCKHICTPRLGEPQLAHRLPVPRVFPYLTFTLALGRREGAGTGHPCLRDGFGPQSCPRSFIGLIGCWGLCHSSHSLVLIHYALRLDRRLQGS